MAEATFFGLPDGGGGTQEGVRVAGGRGALQGGEPCSHGRPRCVALEMPTSMHASGHSSTSHPAPSFWLICQTVRLPDPVGLIWPGGGSWPARLPDLANLIAASQMRFSR
jgi:hypothetical protein